MGLLGLRCASLCEMISQGWCCDTGNFSKIHLVTSAFRTVKFGLLKRTLVVGGFLLKNYRKSKAVNIIKINLNAQNYDKRSRGMTGIIVIKIRNNKSKTHQQFSKWNRNSKNEHKLFFSNSKCKQVIICPVRPTSSYKVIVKSH